MSQLPDDVAIRVHDIHKDFHLPHNNEDSIKHKIITAFEKKDKEIDVQHALRGITFDIKKGEFFGILGRNGSGKSTLLKIISEIYMPTSGYVQHRGSLVAFIELGVGFNPQLTGRENVYLNASLLGFSRKEIDVFYDEVVDFAELREHMEQKLKNYSSGMKVRLAFSVAIRADADILVLDEVLAVGDASFQKKCYEYFKTLKESHKTIVFVSHSMGQVKEYCDRAILIEDGKIVFEGTGENAASEYLRLFVTSKDTQASQSNEHWGTKAVQITKVSATVNTDKVTFTVHTHAAEEPITGAILGVDIYTSDNKFVGGFETLNLTNGRFDYTPHEQKVLTATVDNIFGTGDFLATVAVKSKGNIEIYDFWKHVAQFANSTRLDPDRYFPVILPAAITPS